jgi:peroxiredoxin
MALIVALAPLGWLHAGDVAPVAAPAADADSPIGRQVADFTLRDTYGRPVSLGDLAGSRLVVVAFLGIDCPLVRLYGPRLEVLSQAYNQEEVGFIGINANKQDTPTRLGAFAKRYGLKFPILKDADSSVADAFGAIRTPEIFVLDEQRVIRYWGRVDDQYGFTSGVGYARPKATRNDLKEAIDELLAGKPVSVAVTDAPGCHIGRVPKTEPHGEVTYSNQIARIFNDRCVECHRPGQIGPFPMTTYDEVHGWGEMIREVVDETRMPPWYANPEHGKFANECRLSEEEKNLIALWVENGQPEGDPADLPELPQFTEGWSIPQPDAVFYMNEEGFEVPAEGVVEYQHFTVDPGFTEDKWIKAVQAKPGNQAVVHHIIVFISKPTGRKGRFRTGGALIGYAPGMQARLYPDGHAIHVPAGSKLVFQMHYTPVGTAQVDRSSVGMVFADDDDVEYEIRGGVCGTQDFVIPAGAAQHEIVAEQTLERDTTLWSMMPHMHLRGIAFRYEATYPDGNHEVLLDVPHYDFNWQLWYDLAQPKLLPAGTVIKCTAVFDNSEENVYNPDPKVDVRFGEQTWEEMMFGWYSTVVSRAEAANIPEQGPGSL